MKQIIIVGGNVAGIESAVLLAADPGNHVLLFAGENLMPYRRPMLSKFARTPVDEDPESAFFIKKPSQLAEMPNLELKLGSTVTAIDRAAREVLCGGERFGYDKLLLATGGNACLPKIPGLELPGVMTLRTLSDMRRIAGAARRGRRGVVLGGGVLGLEIAESLILSGCSVTVVEFAPQLLGSAVAPEIAESVRKHLSEIVGLTLRIGESLTGATGNGRIEKVTVSGAEIPCDFLVGACGMRPEITLASSSGLATGRGIVVDRFMATSDPAIYAAGDCAEVGGRVYGLYMASRDMAQTAARNIAAAGVAGFEPKSYPARLAVFGRSFVLA